MSRTICAFDHKEWKEAGLKDYCEFSYRTTYCNQKTFGDTTEGEWWYADPEKLVIYSGSWGNYNSPGADSYTYAEIFDDPKEFEEAVAAWAEQEEWLSGEEEEDEEDEEEEEDEEDDWDYVLDEDDDDYGMDEEDFK